MPTKRRGRPSARLQRPPRSTAGDELAGLRDELRELRRTHADAHRTMAHLSDAVAARDRFIAAAGHELRNPVSALVLSVTHLIFRARRTPGTPDWVLERLSALDAQSKSFVRRASTLLDVSRLTRDSVRLDRELVSLNGIVREVGLGLAPQAARAGCEVELALDAEVVGRWDRAAVGQITENLLANAIRYGAGHPVAVQLRADPAVASLSIRDRGMGIAEDERARMFEPFERAMPRAEPCGFGVGLWIARQLAMAHGGDIAVESEPGSGSVFTATLPRGIHEPHP